MTYPPDTKFVGSIYGGAYDGQVFISTLPTLMYSEPLSDPVVSQITTAPATALMHRVWPYRFVPRKRLGRTWVGWWVTNG